MNENWRKGVKKVLEIGLAGGSSLRLWEDWFPNAKIYGIDEDPGRMKMFNSPDWIIGKMRQEDFTAVRKFGREHGPWDVIIDDAGHIPEQGLTSFLILRHLSDIFIVEDVRNDHIQRWPADATIYPFSVENILVFKKEGVHAFNQIEERESVSLEH